MTREKKAHLKAILSIIISIGVVYGNYFVYVWKGGIINQNAPFFINLIITSISTLSIVAVIALLYMKIVRMFISEGI